eukprot:2220406-Amphidinium_carterae.2
MSAKRSESGGLSFWPINTVFTCFTNEHCTTALVSRQNLNLYSIQKQRMVQSTLKSWTFVGQAAKAAKAKRQAAEVMSAAEKKQLAAIIGLSRPPPKRFRGRPSLQQLCQDALYKHINNGDLPVGVSGDMPIWWARGKPVVLDDDVVLCDVAQSIVVVDGTSSSTNFPVPAQDLEALQVCEDAGQEAVGAEDALEETVANKRKTIHLAHEVKVWLLDYAEAQQNRFGWSMRRSLTQAKTPAPELFSHVDPCVPTRWERTPKKSSTGRPSKIKDAHVDPLCDSGVANVCPVIACAFE